MSQSTRSFRNALAPFLCSAVASVILTACATSPGTGPSIDAELAAAGGDPDKLLIVDCLLPGQVRRLGTAATFITARRPIKTTVSLCEIRGGEYVAYDRADLRTVLNFWLPSAESGDTTAQNYVGEIYERGLGVSPDYAKAAEWYRRAAEQGDQRAMANLGALYERGLGVPADKVQAINWYRRASGLTGDQLAFATSISELETRAERSEQRAAAAEREAAQLRSQMDRLQRELQDKARQQQSTRQQLEQARQRVRQQPAQATPAVSRPAPADDREVNRLKQQLTQQIQEQSRIEQEAELLRVRLEAEQQGRAAMERQLQSLEQRLATARQEREKLTVDSGQLRTEQVEQLTEARQQLIEARQALEQQNQLLTGQNTAETEALRRELAESSRRIAELEQALAASRDQQSDLESQRVNLDRARQELEQTRRQLEGQQAALGAVDSEELARLNAQLERQSRELAQREEQVQILEQQLELSTEQLASAEGRIQALEKETEEVRLVMRGMSEAAPAEASAAPTSVPVARSVNFGTYHALVIGNNQHARLPDLQTAVGDARAVADVLRSRYGFQVELLLNATRGQILTALNKYRAQLTENDNFLLYYAGHGELDEANDRGHWLPVDAAPDDTTNWIANNQVTDILNVMNAKHVMVIADSCYSGTLTRSVTSSIDGDGRTPEQQTRWLELMTRSRSRTVLTSGGLQPVLDGGGGGHSIFANQLLQALRSNDGLLEGPLLYREIARQVSSAASRLGVDQRPEYAPIQFAGDVGAPFFFRPVGSAVSAISVPESLPLAKGEVASGRERLAG